MNLNARFVNMRTLIRELFETVILALLIFLVLHISVQNFQVQGPSMQPTLTEGAYVLVNKLVYMRIHPKQLAGFLPFVDVEEEQTLFAFHPPRRDEVIIFRYPRDITRDFVKRVVGLPGDTVELKGGQLFVNNVAVEEPYITRPDTRSVAPTVVPEDSYFVLGDNRRVSNDSRDWGPVPTDNIVGRAWVSFWPLDRWQALTIWP
jgi:signal peptidase I